jgi:hypothetical protein
MPRAIDPAVKTAIEVAIEAGKSPALIAAECSVSIYTVYRIRGEVQALRLKHDLPPLPAKRPGRKRQEFTDTEQAIRAEYLATGAIRPTARKFNVTTDKVRHVINREPSAVAERAAKQEEQS